MSRPQKFPALIREEQEKPIRLAAPTPAIIVEWPTGVYYGNHDICPCCEPSEAEGLVAFLPTPHSGPSLARLNTATEEEALVLIDKAMEWACHRVSKFQFHTHPGNRYCWHRCSFDLEFWPSSLAFPSEKFGRLHGWLVWPWRPEDGYEARPWGE
jgi:hypothetical protein